MCNYKDFVNDYNNPNLTAHDVRRIHQLNTKRYSEIRKLAILNGDIPAVRHMNSTGAKFYTKTGSGDYQVQKTINGKKVIIGRFKTKEDAEAVVDVCKSNNWELNKVRDVVDKHRIQPKNYTCINGCWIIQKSVNGRNVVFNSFKCEAVDEETVRDVVEFYRRVNWNECYKDGVYELFNIT